MVVEFLETLFMKYHLKKTSARKPEKLPLAFNSWIGMHDEMMKIILFFDIYISELILRQMRNFANSKPLTIIQSKQK